MFRVPSISKTSDVVKCRKFQDAKRLYFPYCSFFQLLILESSVSLAKGNLNLRNSGTVISAFIPDICSHGNYVRKNYYLSVLYRNFCFCPNMRSHGNYAKKNKLLLHYPDNILSVFFPNK